ncbi:sulfurtransferase TusA family protein [Consotaella aegiceratis]|uniref:sulfurtransferase TusA family protein n=1 Tax=Consotaella aegiceratis TaxID=3097961 RepID=UPI002F40D952
MADTVLDTRGLNCPLPVLKTRKALRTMAAGEILEVLASDPLSVIDLPAFCRESGNDLLDQTQDGSVYRFVIRRAG